MMEVKTSTGLRENIAAALCYLAWWISGFIFLLLEPDNKYVRFHAMQSILALGSVMLLGWVVGFVPVIGYWTGMVVWAGGAIVWVLLMYKAYMGVKFKLPAVGNVAEKWADSIK
jgi:uncharacterized membrane protein